MYILTYKNPTTDDTLYLKLADYAYEAFYGEGLEEYNSYDNYLTSKGYELKERIYLLIKSITGYVDGIYDKDVKYRSDIMDDIIHNTLNELLEENGNDIFKAITDILGELFNKDEDEEEST